MGRAIDMEKDIQTLKHQVNEIFLILDEISKVGTKQEHIDIHEATKEEKTDTKGDGDSSSKPNKGKSNAKAKSGKNSGSSK
tara:strand:+ start:3463 stop:3705 length:243 start_codon:yes stop_codon:yes gene_type:complete